MLLEVSVIQAGKMGMLIDNKFNIEDYYYQFAIVVGYHPTFC